MGTHWTDRRAAKAMIGAELARRGWKLYGWKEDRSDSMTDYYDPESWDGLAEKDGALVVVDTSEASTGHQPMRSACDVVGACERCGGSGEDPEGWTYEKAKADPRAWHAAVNSGTGCVSLLPDVVSPIPFRDYGAELCRKCHGGGKVYGNHRMEPDEPAWPAHQGNPQGRAWHVERDGRILASGVGVFAVASEKYHGQHDIIRPDGSAFEAPPEHWDEAKCCACGEVGEAGPMRREDCPKARPKLRALVDRIELAAAGRDGNRIALPPHTCDVAVAVRGSERPGNVELVFPSKPSEEIREELKRAGFRWSRFSSCWYGAATRLPRRYGDAPKAPDPMMRDPGEDAADRWSEANS